MLYSFLKKSMKNFNLFVLYSFYIYLFIYNFGVNDVIDIGVSFYSIECIFIFVKCGLF